MDSGAPCALARRAVGVRLVRGARVTALSFGPAEAVVESAEGGAWTAPLVVDAGGRYAPSLRLLGLKREDPEFQIGVALFFSSFGGAVPYTWDRHLYGTNGAMISGGRNRPGLYRYICEADLADKQAEGLRPIDFIETMARRHDPWLAERFTSEPRVGEPWAMAPIGYRVLEVVRPRLLSGDRPRRFACRREHPRVVPARGDPPPDATTPIPPDYLTDFDDD